jgi:predicted transposase YdaD
LPLPPNAVRHIFLTNPKLSRQEIEAMLKIESLRNTRVFQEGVEEGVEKGRQEGELRGQREMLLKQLNRKFGSLNAQVVSQVQAIDNTEKLEQLAVTLMDAPDLQAFLLNL